MDFEKKFNVELAEEIRNVAIEKQLNFLIGSGCSSRSMPLMNQCEGESDEERNSYLVKEISDRTRGLLEEISSQDGSFDSTKEESGRETEDEIKEKIKLDQITYENFVRCVVELLNSSNSRQVPKTANIFTTNYDLYIEKGVEEVLRNYRFVFNDGANGYFNRRLDSTNYNRVVAFKGVNDNYISEIPSLNLMKPHGSVNWEKREEDVLVLNQVAEKPMVVPPTGNESRDTFLDNHFHEILRAFQLELDKPQSVLLVSGFSFQDKHIAGMVNRALQNPELLVYVFAHMDSNKPEILKNLGRDNYCPRNLKIITPRTIFSDHYQADRKEFTLDDLTEVLNNGRIIGKAPENSDEEMKEEGNGHD
ncbi:SIR2 family protein [Gleimia sp. 6138-11-ORH1]|uniref:SIR2 family protein n=1 Tax=Gleimia sp. 6138-11-ORH1 TaxID=2973937 RepID=UPI002168EB69|nr:SIR2 family protein [Gleimia sp. 6138-11-ORH1]MCS4483940.1 SIR2 family protein [Gleimia sp. 6138-11-ORH1]